MYQYSTQMYNTTNTPTVLQTHTMLNPQDPAVQIMHYNTLRSIQQSYNPVPLSTLNSLPVRYVQMDQLLRNPAQDQFVSTMTMAPVVGMSINQPQMNMQQIPKIQMQPQIPTPAQIQQITNTVKMQQQRFETPTLNMKQLSSIDMLKSYPEVFRRDSLSNSELLRSAAILPTQPLSRISTDVDTSSPLFDGVMLFEQENRSSKNRSSSSYRWKKVSPDVHRRSRLYSGSSCYESDASDNSSDDLQWQRPRTKRPSSMVVSGVSTGGRSQYDSNESPTDHALHVNYSSAVYEKHNGQLLPSINSSVSSDYVMSKKNNRNIPKLLQYINDNIIGKDFTISGPWGIRKKSLSPSSEVYMLSFPAKTVVYCDYIASGKALHFIEHYIKTNVLPLYGNTHSENSICALQTSKFREEARTLIKSSVNATDDDVVIFAGSGTTGAIHKLVTALNLTDKDNKSNTVVIISAFEHHSNILPWKETGVEIVRIPLTNQGIIDKNILKEKLQHYTNLKKKIICSLNAASNITGIRTDVESISTLIHMFNGLVFWDYATAAPYVKIDMNSSALGYKDAIFISVHKFIGGPGSPGVLIAKKHLFQNRIPGICGGGTVNYVTRTCHEYNKDIEVREEGGTPEIVGSIRAGLVFQLKDALGDSFIEAEENSLVKKFFKRFRKNDNLIILGSHDVPRLAVFSFLIYVPSVCKYLHHNFVCRLLNDLFGIQVRAGCACAGPYALDLLGIDDVKAKKFVMFMTEEPSNRIDPENDKVEKMLLMKPGFCRLNLPYFSTEEEINFILNALEFVANNGWKLLPLYTYEPVDGIWKHRGQVQSVYSSLDQITYKGGKMQQYRRKEQQNDKLAHDPIKEARLIMDYALMQIESVDYRTDPPLNLIDKYKDLIWFVLPMDIAMILANTREGQEQSYNNNELLFISEEAKQPINQKHSSRRETTNERRRNDSTNRNKKHTRTPSQYSSSSHRSYV